MPTQNPFTCQQIETTSGSLRSSPLHCRRTRDNLAELGSDLGLPRTVVHQADFLQHLVGVLGCTLHGGHAGRLLRDGTLQVETVYDGSVVELLQVVPHLVDRRLEGVDIHRLGELRPVHGHGLVERHDLCHLSFVCHQAPELVAADPQLQGICSDDLLRDDGRSTESPRNLGALLESSREAVAVESLQGSTALGTNSHVLGGVASCLISRHSPTAHFGNG
mmetsp:Transcript_42097/g.136231  ORF Transcript_42097/g.136231 Transcript_42097/m.136231 type:complete len:220 (-) Transcript_42097:409-1068(-)